ETIDYGPCAFMDNYDPATVFSSIDHQGRYAYGNQPGIAHWNLARLAQALLPVMHTDDEQALAMAQESLDSFSGLFQASYRSGMARKLGLSGFEAEDESLAAGLLELMAQEQADFTLTFRRLADLAQPETGSGVGELFEFSPLYTPWLERWRLRIEGDPQEPGKRQAIMYRANPAYIPRNHLVAAAIDAAVNNSDFSPFNRLVDLLEQPRDYESGLAEYARPPRPEEVVSKTFCGT
ncbi:MAG: protein adenylyltransferase SelO family protein, partial [Xanthomonadales bacterium]|nr:protein adenylyltransferase SelO family protein [Xanthomonadales bacterium]